MRKILAQTLYFTRRNFVPMVQIVLPYLLLLLVVRVALDLFGSAPVRNQWIYYLLLVLVQPYYICRLVKYMNGVATGTPGPLSVSLAEWSNLVVVYLLYGALVVAGLLLFVLPGIYLAARLGFAEFAAVIDGARPHAALRESWQRTAPHVLTLIAGALLIGGTLLLLQLPLYLLVGTAGGLTAAADLASELLSVVGMLVMTVFYFRVYDLSRSPAQATP